MPLPANLLKLVLDSPDSDAPRRDAAQWCHNNWHTHRAELIEKQLELAVMAYNPDDAAYDLAFDTQRLTEKHGKGWLQFDELDQLVDDHQYFRGFVERVSMPAEKFLQHADTLFHKSPIKHLDLSAVDHVAQQLCQSPQLVRIVSLSLAECALTDAHMQLLADSPCLGQLRWLSLMLNKVGMPGTEALARSKGLAKLEYVNFYGNDVDPTEQLVVDQGVVLERILPEEGEFLETQHGPILWLHPHAELEADLPPNRLLL